MKAVIIALAISGASAFTPKTHGRRVRTRPTMVVNPAAAAVAAKAMSPAAIAGASAASMIVADAGLAGLPETQGLVVAGILGVVSGFAVAGGQKSTPPPPPTASGGKAITKEEVLACQAGWVNAIQDISAAYLEKGDFVGAAGDAAGALYGYGHHDVLFKPTKATKNPFRPTGEEAMSYFVGADNFPGSDKFKGEDGGFAINGGMGWKKVVFNNHKISLNGGTALAMGSYDFTCATTGAVNTVEYTFGYKRCADGKPRIYLHHSSVPYSA
eukprot:CAMPEP_0182523556 /NCGR_PEP_ID=MMETSP1323-20130603/1142_1 /TAXON_ID=236787 /ORGANISM="Florenciella parvula, Strain RCC1693" /LENGTH=269 /DNA_ID=CAMNT_0024731953 /DNA_START=20 /DNA_END=829 /DNA_ORIENTATION=+